MGIRVCVGIYEYQLFLLLLFLLLLLLLLLLLFLLLFLRIRLLLFLYVLVIPPALPVGVSLYYVYEKSGYRPLVYVDAEFIKSFKRASLLAPLLSYLPLAPVLFFTHLHYAMPFFFPLYKIPYDICIE